MKHEFETHELLKKIYIYLYKLFRHNTNRNSFPSYYKKKTHYIVILKRGNEV